MELENYNDPAAPSKVFTYDSAYDSTAKTESIYNDICYSLVEVSIRFFGTFLIWVKILEETFSKFRINGFLETKSTNWKEQKESKIRFL